MAPTWAGPGLLLSSRDNVTNFDRKSRLIFSKQDKTDGFPVHGKVVLKVNNLRTFHMFMIRALAVDSQTKNVYLVRCVGSSI